MMMMSKLIRLTFAALFLASAGYICVTTFNNKKKDQRQHSSGPTIRGGGGGIIEMTPRKLSYETNWQSQMTVAEDRYNQPMTYDNNGFIHGFYFSSWSGKTYGKHKDCGWGGCRMVQPDSYGTLKPTWKADHQDNWDATWEKPSDWQWTLQVRDKTSAGTLKYGDRIIIRTRNNDKEYVRYEGDKEVKRHEDPSHYWWYVRPPIWSNDLPGEGGNGATVDYGRPVVLAQTSSSGDTSNCGWYGCRVIDLDSQKQLVPGHGGDHPYLFTFF